ncbi:hypothetical protein [Candidatus Sororendozoicomonas aggregata]|uniref:hypothetical protein n=1 Tax=Candidatus Sororendozoicomonas aggregata TaxID=3073239 RepID=UPI002ED11CDF
MRKSFIFAALLCAASIASANTETNTEVITKGNTADIHYMTPNGVSSSKAGTNQTPGPYDTHRSIVCHPGLHVIALNQMVVCPYGHSCVWETYSVQCGY